MGFPVLLIDDGELDDVRELLAGEGVEFAHLRGAAVPERVDPPSDLLVTTPRRALLAREWPHGQDGRPAKIVVVDEDSQTLRGMLRRMGFDYLVRRPVHPAALRLLLLRALYHGDDKRREVRVPIGCPVTVRARLRRRSAILADLSLRGCGLVMKRPPDSGATVTVQLPAEIAGGRGLSLRGHVQRAANGKDADKSGEVEIAVAFEKLRRADVARVRAILDERADGPAVLADGQAPRRERGKNGDDAAEGGKADRRRHPRARFEREVVALAGDARRVLIGRDISAGGMRIDPHEGLRMGARVQIAIYGSAREEPFLVDAVVVRDDGSRGLGLRFDGVDPAVATRLERIVGGLPAVESLRDGETGSVGTVLTELRST